MYLKMPKAMASRTRWKSARRTKTYVINLILQKSLYSPYNMDRRRWSRGGPATLS